jgi:DNA polymerase-3 subunit gamma/tau
VERLNAIAVAEGVHATDEALGSVAHAADGSLRDAQSILHQVIAYAGERVTAESVAAVLGATAPEVVRAVVEACLAGDAGSALERVGERAAKGADLRAFLLDLLEYLRSLLVVKLTPSAGKILGLSPEAVRDLEEQGRHLEAPHVELALQFLIEAEGAMRRASHPRYVLEMALVRMAEARGLQSLGALVKRLEALETRLGGEAAHPGSQPELFSAEAQVDLPGPAPSPVTGLDDRWVEVRRRIGVDRRSLAVLLAEAAVTLEGEILTLTFANGNHFSRSTLDDPEVRNLIASTIAAVFGRRLQVKYHFPAPGAEVPTQQPTRAPARNHPMVREVIELFGGRIVDVQERGDAAFQRGEP